jgi:uncharacterized protein
VTEKRLEPGFFCWVDAAVAKPKVIHTFFSQLFGWGRRVRPTEDAQAYSIMTNHGRHVVGICAVEQAGPSQWMSYLLVDELRGATERAQQLGGKAVQENLEIADFGTMTVMEDPTGALFALWETKRGEFSRPRLHGNVSWQELMTSDVEQAKKFYQELVGWSSREIRFGGSPYTVFQKNGTDVGSVFDLKKSNLNTGPFWLVYFAVDDCDETASLCSEIGGSVATPPFNIEGLGRCAMLKDPSGGVFGVMTYATAES